MLATGRLVTFVVAGLMCHASFAATPNKVVPRNIQFANLTTEIGLSSEFVHDIAQDGRGYLWFATQAGLDSYDGHDIHVYENVSGDPTSLSHSFTRSLFVDHKGDLWVGTERGVDKYDPETDSFDRNPFGKLDLSDFRVRKIIQDSNGIFWLGTLGKGLLRIDPITDKMTQFKHISGDGSSLPNDYVMALLSDSHGQLWVGTDGGGLAKFDETTQTFATYTHEPKNKLSISGNQIRSIYEDRTGQLWVGTAQGGVDQFDPASGRFTAFKHDPKNKLSLPAGQVSAIYEDSRGTLWFGTENGLAEWVPSIRAFLNYANDPSSPTSLVNNRIYAITQDNSGVLWIATMGGISSWNYFSDTFRYYSAKEGYLKSDLVTCVVESPDGDLWVGTYGGGLSRIDPRTDKVTFYRHKENDRHSLPDDRVMALYVDRRNRLWVGTRDGGLALKNKKGDGFTRFAHNPEDDTSLSGDAISSILLDKKGALWVGVYGGGLDVSMNGDANHFEHFRHDEKDPDSLSSNRVLTVDEDPDGNLWIGTRGAGLDRLDVATGKFQNFDLRGEKGNDGPHGTPWALLETNDGTIWLGTLGQGLIRWSKKDRDAGKTNFEQFAVAQGLASEIYGIVEGAPNKLWLSSNRGLLQFDTRTHEVRKFDNKNGLRTNEFNQGAAYRSRSGRVFFGSTAGLVGFFPGDLPINRRPPEVSIEARSRTETIARTGTGQHIPSVRLSYLNSFIMFDFAALDFTSPDKNLFRYRLVGLDNKWTEVENFRRAVYSSLAPGRYKFELQASNNDGFWNRKGASVNVYVVPPPWSTWWAYVGYLLVLLSLIAWYLRNQKAKQVAANEARLHLEQLVNERTQELEERNDKLLELNDMLEEASVTDALTGLHNRRYVDDQMETELSAMRRLEFEHLPAEEWPERSLLFVMMIDLDEFKKINDTYGHHAGDHALIEVTERLKACCRKSDTIIRWGGDEFLIIGHARTMQGAEQFAERVRQSLKSPDYDIGDGHYGRMSGSIGISYLPFTPGNLDFAGWEQVCNVADLASYLAKDNGRNQWVSICGTKSLTEHDMTGLKTHLFEFAKEGKLRIVSSGDVKSNVIPLCDTVDNNMRIDQ